MLSIVLCTSALAANPLASTAAHPLMGSPFGAQATNAEAATEPVQSPGQDPDAPFTMQWSLQGGVSYQLRSTLETGGRVSWSRSHAHVKGRMPIQDDLELLVGARYQYDNFDFSDTGFGGDPFSGVNTVQLDGVLQWKATPRWQLFAGGQAIFGVGQGADFGDSVTGGGAIGAVYSFSENFSIGGGLGARSQILDDVLIYPIIVVDWHITDRLLLSTRMTSGWANQTGAELRYELKEGVDVGVAAVFDYQRFRLSDDNTLAPGGAGTTEALPLAAFISFSVGDRISLTAFVGANVYGRVKVTDTSRSDVWASTYDPAPMLGVQGTIRF
jgi:hypothetical protein